MSARSSTEKQPKIKGLVKRCRSFKEDIMSRLARNRSLGKDDGNSPSGHNLSRRKVGSPSGWTSGGTSPIPTDSDITDPILLITHRLKEAYLTLQFVESLIQKNCVDLLGGSSNVMLDLMGCLLNDIKKTSASDSAAYQSAISQIKSALSDFLTAVDVLLLKDRCDEVQRELYFEKVLDTLKSTREALARLKSLIETKENGHHHQSNSVRHHSTSHVPSQNQHHHLLQQQQQQQHRQVVQGNGGGLTSTPKLLNSPSSKSDSSSPFGASIGLSPGALESEEKRPPLPPKLKQWSAKSFDLEWPTTSSTSPGPSSPYQLGNTPDYQSSSHHHNNNLSPHHQSLLSQWLEQSSASINNNTNHNHSSASSATSANSSSRHHHYHHQRSNSHHVNQYQRQQQRQQIHSTSSASKFEGTERDRDGAWTESAIYEARSSSSSASHSKLMVGSNTSLLNLERKTHRTYSDSYQLDSQESLDKLDYDSRSGRSGATHNSQSLSLGSSLDNLLLVDSNSQQSGLSPNSNTSGGGGGGGNNTNNNANRISVSSNISNNTGASISISGAGTHGLASLSNYDPDADLDVDPDADNVFVSSEVLATNCTNQQNQQTSPRKTEQVISNNSNNDGPPPSLPEKQNRRHFLLGSQPQGQQNNSSNNGNGTSHYFTTGSGNGTGSNYTGSSDPRCPSPYENVDETDLATWHGVESKDAFQQQQKTFMSYSESRNTLVGATGYDSDERPPLPPKKKHSLIAAYVEFLHNFESFSQQHHNHFHNHLNHIHHQHHQSSQNFPEGNQALENQRRAFRSERSATLHNPGGVGISGLSSISGPGSSAMPRAAYSTSYHQFSFSSSLFSPTDETSPTHFPIEVEELEGSPVSPTSDSRRSFENGSPVGNQKPPALPPKKTRHFLQTLSSRESEHSANSSINSIGNTRQSPVPTEELSPARVIPAVITPVHTSTNNSLDSPQLSLDDQNMDLFIMDASSMLVPNDSLHANNSSNPSSGKNSDGPEIKGGEPYVLIVYAASPDLKDLRFREVFLLTYRTFVRPVDVVNLLWKRNQHFEKKTDRPSIVHARATLDLFVEVVNSLTPMDLEDEMVSKLRNCIYHLVSCGEIQNALKARKGLIVKYQIRLKLLSPKPTPASLAVTSETQTLLQWGATSIAQQMTLLDAELFRQLEPAELLLWAREQSEDFCPALNNFTEHFNKVSYWARSKVLLCSNSRERNRTMKKMIEVMRKLREYNNFNSLLAVLAALDSAPIRRLGFSRRLTEALKPHAALTDSSGSFRTYRQALAESKPPCIPYIGLVLQDLTFVHIGNADFLPDGKVNWVKRWQQWVVLEPVRRFQACNYGFVRNDPLLAFLNNFDESLNDDELWQLSESIKPRGKS